MAGEWHEATLAQLGRIVTGRTPPTAQAEFYGGKIPFVTPTDFDGRRIIDRTGRNLTDIGADIVASAWIPADAVMVSCIGSDMGKVALSSRDSVTNQQINSIIVNEEHDALFVYYNLSQRRAEIKAAAGGSAQPILNKTAFGFLEILLPPLPEQRAIAHILGTLDDRIEANRQMAATLEEMAQALFRAWFVNFDPVRAKAGGRWRPGQTLHGFPASLYDAFPDCLVKTEHGEIPKGWKFRPLSGIAEFLNGLALQKFPATTLADSLPVIKIAELRNGVSAKCDRASRALPPQYIVRDGDFLFSWSGSLLAKFWTEGDGALNQHLFKVTSQRYPAWFFSKWVQHHLEEFQRIASFKATTMGHIQRGHLDAAMTCCPPDQTIARLGAFIAPLVSRTVLTALETRNLTALRDTLLPQLVSGTIQVKNAEAFLKAHGL